MLGYQGSADAALSIIAQFGPTLAAFVIVFYAGASIRGWAVRIVRWRASPRWYAVAFGLPAALIGVQGAVFGLLGYPLDLLSIPGRLVNFLPSAIILALIAGLGEEPGWRGFALPRLQRPAMHRYSRRRSLASFGQPGTCRWRSWIRGSRTASRLQHPRFCSL